MSVLPSRASSSLLPRRKTNTSPVTGFAWFIWQRHRFGLLLCVAGLLLESAMVRVFPAVHTSLWVPVLLLPLVAIFLYVVVAFTLADSDLSAVESAYPLHLLRLPVRTEALALWPMVLGTGALATMWVLAVALVAAPLGLHWPYLWPATMLMALFAWLQVVLWHPFPLSYLRPFVTLPLVPLFLGVPALASAYGLAESAIAGSLLFLTVLALPVSIVGLARGRRGGLQERSWAFTRKSVTGQTQAAPPFSSPMQAQFWAEWQRNGAALPVMVGVDCLVVTLLLLLLGDPTTVAYPGGITVEGLLAARMPFIIPALVPIIGAVTGCGLRRSDSRRQDFSIPVFLATRPLTSAEIVLAKVRAAMLSAVLAWGIILGFGLLWLSIIRASDGSGSGSLLRILLPHLSGRVALQGLTIVGLSLLVTWKNQTDSLFANLAGKASISIGYVVVAIAVMAGAAVSVIALVLHPEWREPVQKSLPCLLTMAVVTKIIGGVLNARRLYQTRQMPPRLLWQLAAGWAVLAVGLPLLVQQLLPSERLIPLGYLYAAIILLCLPMVRLSLAPLTLEANRRQ